MPLDLNIEIPKPLENLMLPDPALATYWENAINYRTWWIDADIDETLLEICRQIIHINRLDKDVPVEDRKPIVLWIFSFGGDLDSTLSFLDICQISKTPIITINAGVAMSAGLLIMLAGHKRYCLPRSRALIHSGSGTVSGTFEQSEAAMQDYKRSVDVMRQYIVDRSGMDMKLFNKKKNKEWYLDAKEQVENGIAHGVLDDLQLAL